MAETAKILNPERKVLIPASKAGCSLASSITAEDVRKIRSQYPGVPVVTYINTYADVKAESDICVTSGNVVKVIKSLNEDTIIFLPDEFMARNVAEETGKKVLFPFTNEKKADGPVMIGWKGRCEVHAKFTVEDVLNARKQFPGVKVITHPEAPPEVVKASDYSAGTTAMVDYVKNTNAPHYLVLTECSMGDNIIAENPEKNILRMCSVRCPHMNEITLEDTLAAIREDKYEVDVPEDIRKKALNAVQRMLEFH
jgi:quinolinate synthase